MDPCAIHVSERLQEASSTPGQRQGGFKDEGNEVSSTKRPGQGWLPLWVGGLGGSPTCWRRRRRGRRPRLLVLRLLRWRPAWRRVVLGLALCKCLLAWGWRWSAAAWRARSWTRAAPRLRCPSGALQRLGCVVRVGRKATQLISHLTLLGNGASAAVWPAFLHSTGSLCNNRDCFGASRVLVLMSAEQDLRRLACAGGSGVFSLILPARHGVQVAASVPLLQHNNQG